jgi:hypothetical protein
VPAARVGRTGGHDIQIGVGGQLLIDCPVAEAETRWRTGLSSRLAGRAA